jgi:hypothetical protein
MAFEEFVPYEELNALFQNTGEWLSFLAGGSQFDSVRAAIEGLDEGESATVNTFDSSREFGSVDANNVGEWGAANLTNPELLDTCTDGRRVYALFLDLNDSSLHAVGFDPRDLDGAAEITFTMTNAHGGSIGTAQIVTDGDMVVVSTKDEIEAFDVDTAASLWVNDYTSVTDIAIDGMRVYALVDTDLVLSLARDSGIVVAISTSTFNYDSHKCITSAGGITVLVRRDIPGGVDEAFGWMGGGTLWGPVTLSGIANAGATATNGTLAFIGTSDAVEVLDLRSGSQTTIAMSASVLALGVDGRYLFVAAGSASKGGTTYIQVFDIVTIRSASDPVWSTEDDVAASPYDDESITSVGCDGESIFVGTRAGKIRPHYLARPARKYTRVGGGDIYGAYQHRRPFYNLLLPDDPGV